MRIPFNKVSLVGSEIEYVLAAVRNNRLSGDGPFTKRCHAWLEERLGCASALLTHSCTAALEMSALLLDVGPGDEVIMPSYTFVSTANAFALRGAVPVFVDIDPTSLNIDPREIEPAITGRTKAIVVVHYAGVGCDMDEILAIARRHGLAVVEDAAQGISATYRGRPLGSFGSLAALSFHETKNVISGEGGALVVNDPGLSQRAEIVREKGTNRSRFFRGEVDKYTWVDLGSSFLPSEILAAFLMAQLEKADEIRERRVAIWNRYHEALADAEREGILRRPIVPADRQHNGHMYYLLAADASGRAAILESLKREDINAVFHYVPLHSSPAGRKFGRASGPLPVTDRASDCLLRLPLWADMDDVTVDRVIDGVQAALVRR